MSAKSIIIFDGECNLCNGVVGWLISNAPKTTFQYVPFQSGYGQALLKKYHFPTTFLDTVILIDNSGIKTHSDGFLSIISKLPKWRGIAFILSFIPKIFRDTVYKIASKNRVKWFGKSASCSLSF